MQYYEEIKARLTMPEVIQRYHTFPNRAHFVCCPFHIEKTPSMKISKDGYYCFGCGKHGNIFGFVMEMFNLDFRQACDKLNFDFGLNIPTKTHLSKEDKIRMLEEKKKRDRIRNEQEMLMSFKERFLQDLDMRQFKISCKMNDIKDMLYSGGKFLCNMTEDEEFENLCAEFIALKKNFDIIDFNITIVKTADIDRMREIYSATGGKVGCLYKKDFY